MAISVAVIAAESGEPAFGLIALVPLIQTDPDLADNPWGENESTLGLTPDRLLSDLKTTFDGKYPDCRDHWHSNPYKMSDEVVRMLPSPTIMVFAALDILYESDVEFKNRLQANGVKVSWMKANGLHQVKDMDQVTEAGRKVRQYATQKSIEFVERAKCSPQVEVSQTVPQKTMAGARLMCIHQTQDPSTLTLPVQATSYSRRVPFCQECCRGKWAEIGQMLMDCQARLKTWRQQMLMGQGMPERDMNDIQQLLDVQQMLIQHLDHDLDTVYQLLCKQEDQSQLRDARPQDRQEATESRKSESSK